MFHKPCKFYFIKDLNQLRIDHKEQMDLLPFILNATKNIASIDTGKKHLYSKR